MERGNRRRWSILASIIVIVLGLMVASSVSAHALMVNSSPPANAVLAEAPEEIRLWFTETLEPEYSSFVLRNTNGDSIEVPASQVEADGLQIFMRSGDLPDGAYTVTWRVVSVSDGHETSDSFNFSVGPATNASQLADNTESIPFSEALVRWADLFGMAIAIGSSGFWLFAWQPAVSGKQKAYGSIERRMQRLMWSGWILLGLVSVLKLGIQASVFTNQPIAHLVAHPAQVGRIILDTRFGYLWAARMALWSLYGFVLWAARARHRFYWAGLVLGAAILMTHSLFSHASSTTERVPAIAGDWIHLTAAALWIGGLLQFANVISPLRRIRTHTHDEAILAHLAGYFANFSRIVVSILVITGIYALWLQVGTLEGLVTTLYGRALLIKIILIGPLLAIGAINHFLTVRRLRSRSAQLWERRLRNLLGAEIGLNIGVLAAIGVMSSVVPARDLQNLRAALPEPSELEPVVERLSANNLSIWLELSSGVIGENSLTLILSDSGGEPLTPQDGTDVIISVNNQTERTDPVELRPEHQGDGVYSIPNLNIESPGVWRFGVAPQHPERGNAIATFLIDMVYPPASSPIPLVVNRGSSPGQIPALLLTGLAGLGISSYLLASRGVTKQHHSPATLLGAFFVVSGMFLGSGLLALRAQLRQSALLAAFEPTVQTPTNLEFVHDSELPLLITKGGNVLEPSLAGLWQPMDLDARVNDIYVDYKDVLWAATDSGVLKYDGRAWEVVDDVVTDHILMTHGSIFAMGGSEMVIVGPEYYGPLDVPGDDFPASDFVMLGNHTHVLQNGDSLFHTVNLGLSWEPIESPPGTIYTIWTDLQGKLMVATDEGVMVRNNDLWRLAFPLPDDMPITSLRLFDDLLYAISGGRLYRQNGAAWDEISLSNVQDAYINDLAVRYPSEIWALDAAGLRLWSSTDGVNWIATPVTIASS